MQECHVYLLTEPEAGTHLQLTEGIVVLPVLHIGSSTCLSVQNPSLVCMHAIDVLFIDHPPLPFKLILDPAEQIFHKHKAPNCDKVKHSFYACAP